MSALRKYLWMVLAAVSIIFIVVAWFIHLPIVNGLLNTAIILMLLSIVAYVWAQKRQSNY